MTDPGALRDDLAELLRRRALTEDAARPDAVAARHERGGRTARENVADLVDPGSWGEYGRVAIAAPRPRRPVGEPVPPPPPHRLGARPPRIGRPPGAGLG